MTEPMEITIKRATHRDAYKQPIALLSGKSVDDVKMTWPKALALGHSVIRAQEYYIEFRGIPLYVASQLVRHTAGVQWWQKSKRVDRGGKDFEIVCADLYDRIISKQDPLTYANEVANLPNEFDRLAPTDLCCIANAEAIINISRKRLCYTASRDTREIWGYLVGQLYELDPDLAKHCVKPCVACGICRESKPCGFMNTTNYATNRGFYKSLFKS